MPSVEKISIALTQDMAALVREAVESGDYASASEVVRDALRAWKLKRALEEQQVAEVRRLWREGLDSGPAGALDVDALKQAARARHEAARQRKPVTKSE